MEVIIPIIIWAVVRMLIAGAKKNASAKPGTMPSNAPKTTRQQMSGGWAEMLGIPTSADSGTPQTFRRILNEIESSITDAKPAELPKPIKHAKQAQRPVQAPASTSLTRAPLEPMIASSFVSGEGTSSSEGTDDCHGYMLPDAALEATPTIATDAGAVTDLGLRWDAPALVQGIVMAEILTRPAQRRRPGTWQSR